MDSRATSGDEQPVADWLRLECDELNSRQQQRVVARFTADEHEVFTRGALAALEEDYVEKILSPLPMLSRHVVSSAAASLRESRAGAKAHADSHRPIGSRRILGDTTGASLTRWGVDPSVAACALGGTWGDLIYRHATGTGATFETGGLGGLKEAPRFGVGPCELHLSTKPGRICTGKRPSQSTFLHETLPGSLNSCWTRIRASTARSCHLEPMAH